MSWFTSIDWIGIFNAVKAWNWTAIFASLWALDTALAEIPQIAANSTFQLVTGWMKKLIPGGPQPPAGPGAAS